MIKIQLGMTYESILSINTAEIFNPGTLLVKINDNPTEVQWRSTIEGNIIEAYVEPFPKAPVYNVQVFLKYPGCMPLIAGETVNDDCVISFISGNDEGEYVEVLEATCLKPQVLALAVAS